MREGIDIFILCYFVAVNTLYATLIILGMLEVARRRAMRLPELDANVLSEDNTPPVSVIAPAYNEEASIVASVRAFLQLEYPDHEVVVVNDGSTDDTLRKLRERFQLIPVDHVMREQLETSAVRGIYRSRRDPRLWVIDKENGGKADALNVGINFSRRPLVCCVDADTLVDRKALLRMVEPFLYEPDRVVAVGGTVRIVNGATVEDGIVRDVDLPDSWLARFQIVEYLRAFLFGRMGYNRLGGNIIISGAFGMFDRNAVIQVGGYEKDTVGEDMEVVVKLQKMARTESPPRKIIHIPDPIAFTEVPEDLTILRRQRDRWHRGLADSLWRHRSMMFNPKYGPIGMFVVPIFVVFELVGPLIELGGYAYFVFGIMFDYVNWGFAAMFFLVAFLWGALLSLQSLYLDWWSFDVRRGERKVRSRLVLAAVLENLGYRQYTLFCRILGLGSFLLGRKKWGQQERRGFSSPTEQSVPDQPVATTIPASQG